MVKAQELRIGNWVGSLKRKPNITPLLIESINQDGVNLYTSAADIYGDSDIVTDDYFKDLQGIELTTDLIEKLGFKKHHGEPTLIISMGDGIYPRSDTYLVYSEGKIIIDVELEYWIGEINTLHQLQNFYFLLTSKELVFKI